MPDNALTPVVRIVLGFLGCMFLLIPTFSLNAQENQSFSSLSPSFRFNDGIYATIDMVKNNRPIPPNWIETDLAASNPNFYEEITNADQIDFYDDHGVRRFIPTDEVWGYCSKGILYVHIGVRFYEIKYLGGVSFFKASKTTYHPPVPKKKTFINSPDYEYDNKILVVNRKEYLISLEENHYWEFDLSGLELILEKDPQLSKEFKELKKRDKKKMKYVFLTRYNEKHPLEIPHE